MNKTQLTKYLKGFYKEIKGHYKNDYEGLYFEMCCELDRLNKDGEISDKLRNDYTFDRVSKVFSK